MLQVSYLKVDFALDREWKRLDIRVEYRMAELMCLFFFFFF